MKLKKKKLHEIEKKKKFHVKLKKKKIYFKEQINNLKTEFPYLRA